MAFDTRRVKKLEKPEGKLPRRRFEDVEPIERIWLYYFDMRHEIVLTKFEEEWRQILEIADALLLRYYPGISIAMIASKLKIKIKNDLNIEREHRQCITYVNQALNIFGEPVDVDKEKKRQLYIKRLNNIAVQAEEKGDYNAAVRALTKAAEIENFNKEGDETLKELIKETKAKEITFTSNISELQDQANKIMQEIAEDAEYEDGN